MSKNRFPDFRNMIDGDGPNHWINPDELLKKAVQFNNISAVHAAVKEGADIALATECLFIAAKHGGDEVVGYLAKLGGDVHAKNADGMTPAEVAVMFNRGDVAIRLLENGADFRNTPHKALPSLARKHGHEALAQALLLWCRKTGREKEYARAKAELNTTKRGEPGAPGRTMTASERRAASKIDKVRRIGKSAPKLK